MDTLDNTPPDSNPIPALPAPASPAYNAHPPQIDKSLERGENWAIAGLVLATIAALLLVSIIFSFLAAFPALLGIICGIVAIKKGTSGWVNTTGLVTNIIAFILGLLILVLVVFFFSLSFDGLTNTNDGSPSCGIVGCGPD